MKTLNCVLTILYKGWMYHVILTVTDPNLENSIAESCPEQLFQPQIFLLAEYEVHNAFGALPNYSKARDPTWNSMDCINGEGLQK